MTGVNVAVVNATALLTDEEVNAVGSQLWDCLREGRAPDWAADARLVFVRRGGVVPRCALTLVIMDEIEQPFCLVNSESTATASRNSASWSEGNSLTEAST